jgi:co-chaperonin GroES (HSP10)
VTTVDDVTIVGARLLVKQDVLEEVDPVFKQARSAGIALPETREKNIEQKAVATGTVVAIGALAWYDWKDGAAWCSIGDRVLYAKYSGYPVVWKGSEYIALNDEDVVAVLS